MGKMIANHAFTSYNSGHAVPLRSTQIPRFARDFACPQTLGEKFNSLVCFNIYRSTVSIKQRKS